MSPMKFSNDHSLHKAQQVLFWVVIGLGAAVLIGLLLGVLVQFLWNSTITEMFETTPISFWQAVGLFLLAKLLIGFGTSSSSSKSKKKKHSRRLGKDHGDAASDPEADADRDEEPFDGDDFRAYWQREGRAAYESYRRGSDSPADRAEHPTIDDEGDDHPR